MGDVSAAPITCQCRTLSLTFNSDEKLVASFDGFDYSQEEDCKAIECEGPIVPVAGLDKLALRADRLKGAIIYAADPSTFNHKN